MNKQRHELHKRVGDLLKKEFGNQVILDPACKRGYKKSSPEHKLPLFIDKDNKRELQYCNVDILIIKNNEVKVILEIDESDIKPTQICGKFLTSALSNYYIYKGKEISMSDSVLFIQVLDGSKLQPNSKKKKQGNKIKQSIQDDVLQFIKEKAHIKKYELMWNTDNYFEKLLINKIRRYLI